VFHVKHGRSGVGFPATDSLAIGMPRGFGRHGPGGPALAPSRSGTRSIFPDNGRSAARMFHVKQARSGGRFSAANGLDYKILEIAGGDAWNSSGLGQ